MNFNKTQLFFIIVLLVFLIDRYFKLISNVTDFCFVACIKRSINFGAAFNLFSGLPYIMPLLIVVGLAVLSLTAFFYFKVNNINNISFNFLHIGLALLFAGTLGNTFDRLFFGYVIDFLSFTFLKLPSFNFADVSNLAGVILIIVALMRMDKESEKR